jgi:transcriptional regulator with XRE-family HTH domain
MKRVGLRLEAGHKKNPSLPTLRKLAKALGVQVTELLGGG